MNLAYSSPRPRPPAGSGRRAAALAGASFAAVLSLVAAPGAGASTLTTSTITRVSVTSSQALPPPYKPGHAVLKSAASLSAFDHAVAADHIGIASRATSSGGCAGGTEYTVVVTYKTSRHTTLDAYDCGGGITGNMTGNVKAFVGYLASVLS